MRGRCDRTIAVILIIAATDDAGAATVHVHLVVRGQLVVGMVRKRRRMLLLVETVVVMVMMMGLIFWPAVGKAVRATAESVRFRAKVVLVQPEWCEGLRLVGDLMVVMVVDIVGQCREVGGSCRRCCRCATAAIVVAAATVMMGWNRWGVIGEQFHSRLLQMLLA